MVRYRRWLASGLCLTGILGCSPTSPIAPDPGEVNIPGVPGQIGPSAKPTPYPTQVPHPGASSTPYPWPSATSFPWPSATPYPYPSSSVEPADPTDSPFVRALRQRGIVPTADDLDQIRLATTVPPTGEWGSKGALSPAETLGADFARYGVRFDPPVLGEIPYQNAAVTFASGNRGKFYVDTQFYKQFSQPLVAKWDDATRQFVLITADGALTTYTTVSVLQAARYLAIPGDF